MPNFVIFVAPSSTIRPPNFTQSNFSFEHCILNEADFEKRSIFSSLLRLHHQLRHLHYRKIVLGGWDLLEFWWVALLFPKRKNSLAVESSIFESPTNGIRGLIKKFFLSNISTAFCSGQPQAALIQAMKFVGKIRFTLGVGIFNYQVKEPAILLEGRKKFHSKFLFVGRLSPEKNIKMLIEAFKVLPHCTLTVIGEGPLGEELEQLATPNILFKGYISNETLGAYYLDHDVFILPSLREPWGLVVEEALFYGLPVVVSKNVGCAYDLVENYKAGILYDPLSVSCLHSAIDKIVKQYDFFQENIKKLDFKSRDQTQVKQYLDELA